MIFRQFFDRVSCTYTYVLASGPGREALIIDPVLSEVDAYLALMERLDLRLVKAVDTHLHADHVTGLGALRDRTRCVTVMGEQTRADVVSMRVREGEVVDVDGVRLDVLYTPGHTDDSYSFAMADRVFTGDTLLIRGTGRTDFQNGDPKAQYQSLFGKLLRLDDATLVFPAHDYKGETVTTIGEERRFNPRLQVSSVDEYVDIMNNLNLSNPKMMDVAVPANLRVGQSDATRVERAEEVTAGELLASPRDAWVYVDMREESERRRDGAIPGSVYRPYKDLIARPETIAPLWEAVVREGRQIVLYCAFGERSALALKAAKESMDVPLRHLAGGYAAWLREDGPVEWPQSSDRPD